MTAVRVRAAAAADIASLSEVGWQSFEDAYRGTADDNDINEHLIAHFGERVIKTELAKPTTDYLLAEYENACAGIIKLQRGAVPKQIDAGKVIEVQQLYVASNRQRLGVGRKLMDAAAAYAGTLGVDGLWLSVWTHAEWATRFYTDYGFVPKGEVTFTLGSSEFTDYLMWLRLKER
ncbi:MAG: GNAT family N-acetyltransferase [Woeseiaceae bacterium]|nr:GNAT family N-acetyltransferase [Woeseiaceae bacterium]